MDGKPRRRLGPALIAFSFAGQAAILAAIIALLLGSAPSPRPAPANGWLTNAPAVMWGSVLSEYIANMGPMYYAALNSRGSIEITRSSSGAGSATVKPPPGLTFTMVTATSDAEMFLAAAQERQLSGPVGAAPVHLYALGLDTPSGDVGLSLLPPIPGAQFWSAILSPDGSKLAVALMASAAGRGGAVPEVRVYTLANDTAKTWSATTPGQAFGGPRQDPALLSWSADGRLLAINWRDPAPGLRVLDTEAPGGSLLAASRMITLPEGQPAGIPGCDSDATLTASAAMVVCAGHGAPGGQAFPSWDGSQSQASLLRFDATTGHPLTAIVPPSAVAGKPVTQVRIMWVSPSGHGFIVASYTGSARPAAEIALIEPVRAEWSLPLDPDMTEWAW